MKVFLNRYMATNKDLTRQSEDDLRQVFSETVTTILSSLGREAFKPERAVNAALADALMVGVGCGVREGRKFSHDTIREARGILLGDTKFVDAISTGTSQKTKVDYRISKATELMAKR
jgi:hypothetical protein